MTDKDVCRYLELVNRRLFIVLNSGVNWKPEYGAELERVDRKIAEFRQIIDLEHRRKEALDGKANYERQGCYGSVGSV